MPTGDLKQQENNELEKLKRIALAAKGKTVLKAIDVIAAYGNIGRSSLIDIAEKSKVDTVKQHALESVTRLRES